MRGNGDGKCFGTSAMSLRDGTKDVCTHVSTPTLKSRMELRKIV